MLCSRSMTVRVGILFSLALFATVTADPCCRPTQWTAASVIETVGEYNRDMDVASLGYANRKYYYDYTGSQLSYVEELNNETAQIKTKSRVIFKYKQGKKYNIDLKSNNCTTEDISGQKMDPPCIPKDATNFGRHTYAGGVAVDMWFIQDKVNSGSIRLGVTLDSCLPLTESRLSAGPDYVLRASLYQNVTVGIADPSVFDVPSICANQHSIAKFYFKKHHFSSDTSDGH